MKQKLKTWAEWDCIHARHFYCYLKRGSTSIKRQLRRRHRHELKSELKTIWLQRSNTSTKGNPWMFMAPRPMTQSSWWMLLSTFHFSKTSKYHRSKGKSSVPMSLSIIYYHSHLVTKSESTRCRPSTTQRKKSLLSTKKSSLSLGWWLLRWHLQSQVSKTKITSRPSQYQSWMIMALMGT